MAKKLKETLSAHTTAVHTPAEIHLQLDENGKCKSTAKGLSFSTMLQMIIPFIVKTASKIYETAAQQKTPEVPALTKKQLEELKLDMYDTMNIAFSNALSMFAPEIEARPNLNEDAIIRAQDELLKEDMIKRGFNPETGEKIG